MLTTKRSLKELQQSRADLGNERDAIISKASGENRGLLASEMRRFDDIAAELETINELIGTAQAAQDKEKKDAASAFAARGYRTQEVYDRSEDDPQGGFTSHRDFLNAVLEHGIGKRTDSRLNRFRATQGSDEQGAYSDPHGGYLIPDAIAPGILSVAAEDDPLATRVTSVPMRVGNLSVNARVDKNHSTSVSGGLTVTRRPETVDGTASRMAFEQVVLNAHELFGLTHVRFAANERTFKFWLRNDGQPYWRSALTPKYGSTLSPFVVIDVRS